MSKIKDINHEESNCKKCNKLIEGHNIHLHEGMCDDCFFKESFSEDTPEKDLLSEFNSKGKCRLCEKECTGKEMKKHLIKCIKKIKNNALLLKAVEGPFFVYFSVPENKNLKDVDKFLRGVWLECCGHLSMFKIGKIYYISNNTELDENEETMDIKVDKVLREGVKCNYEYDFGTTTPLDIECVSKIETESKTIEILARNNQPDFKCNECKSEATDICVYCKEEGTEFLCKKCGAKHKCEETAILPVVNSPRIGMCGFTGEECKLLNK